MALSPEKSAALEPAFKTAAAAHQDGRFAEAIAGYRGLLQAAPNDPQLHYLLGAASIEVGRFDDAVRHLEEALRLRPSHADTVEMMGSAWQRSGEPEKSIEYFREAERLSGGSIEKLMRLANAERLAGRFAEARDTYNRLLVKDPSSRRGQVGLALCLSSLGDTAGAERVLRDCTLQYPDYTSAFTTLAVVLAQAERFADAEDVLRSALSRTPDHLQARKLLASSVHKQGRFEEAEGIYREILRASPGDIQMSLQLAEGLLDVARPDEAEEILVPLRNAAPEHAAVITALGRVHELRGELERAKLLHNEAIAKDPRSENAYLNRGSAKRFSGDYDGALADYDAALALNPGFAPAAANRGLALLTLGRLADAWPAYRARIKALAGAPDLTADKPWDGSSLAGKRVLVWLEYGLGDEILFASLLPELIATAAHCTIVCSRRLRTLFARSFPSASVLAMGDPIAGDFDVRLPLTDFAQLVRPAIGSFPRHGGYLRADGTLTAELRRRYAPTGRERLVGVSWRSASGPSGRFKSTDLAQWADILGNRQFTFVSLQYGDCAEEVARASAAAGREIVRDRDIDTAGDLDRFAAQIAAMDLILSVSNTTVHVAGGLGRPVWVLVPSGPGAHWYWFLNRPDSPWYPSARLFRQGRPGDWTKTFSEVMDALGDWRER